MKDNKNPGDDAMKGRKYRTIRIGQINDLLPAEYSITFVHSTSKKFNGSELQRNNTLSNRIHSSLKNPIGLTALLNKTGEETVYLNIRFFSDPDLYYKVPSDIKDPEEVVEALKGFYWLILDSPEDIPHLINYRLISTEDILRIRNIHYGFSASKGNETRFSFYTPFSKKLKIEPYPVEGGSTLFSNTPSLVEAIKNVFK